MILKKNIYAEVVLHPESKVHTQIRYFAQKTQKVLIDTKKPLKISAYFIQNQFKNSKFLKANEIKLSFCAENETNNSSA